MAKRLKAVPQTLKMLRDEGFWPDVCESFNAYSGQRKDLFGFLDIMALRGNETVGVQVCGKDWGEHITKMGAVRRQNVLLWLEGEHRSLILIGWRKVKQGVGGREVWKPRIAEFWMQGAARSVALVVHEHKGVESISEVLANRPANGTVIERDRTGGTLR